MFYAKNQKIMNCRYFTENLPEYISGEMSADERSAMKEHAAECAECRQELERTQALLDALTPQCVITPPAGFEERILAAAREARNTAAGNGAESAPVAVLPNPRRRVWRIMTATLSAAAMIAVVITVGLGTPARAARNRFAAAIAALDRVESMTMEFRVRTKPAENFSFTDPKLDFVNHTLQVVYTPKLMWRMDKGEHIAVCNGSEVWQWRPATASGSVCATNANVLAELEALVDPRMLMQIELDNARNASGVKYDLENDGELIRLTVFSPAQGDFSESGYRLYSSILESDTRREYTFSEDGRLVGARVIFLHAEGEVALLEVDGINYGVAVDAAAITALPEDIAWVDTRIAPEDVTLVGITAEEAAGRILAAMERWEEPLGEALYIYGENGRNILRQKYEGAKVLMMKKAVRSGDYAGVFIPCTLLLRDGTREETMLAMRTDLTSSGSWIIDGGL